MGKSALALNIAVNSCKNSMKDVVIFSLEMGKEQLVTRMLSSEALVNNTSLRTGKLSTEDWTKLAAGTESLQRLPIYMDDGAGINVPQMKAKLRRMKNLGLVIIDYLPLMSGSGKSESRQQEISEISRICGFSDDKYFFRVFKKICGITPRSYRTNKNTASN